MHRFRNRPSEPWPTQYLKSTLMECYIWLQREKAKSLSENWECPLPSCDKRFSSFNETVTHLDNCEHLNETTKHYKCPCCREEVQIPPISPANKTMLKLKKSLETILGCPQALLAGTSSLVSPLSDAGSSQLRSREAHPLNLGADIKCNIPALKPINTECLPERKYGASSTNYQPSSTTTTSPYELYTGTCSSFQSPTTATSPYELYTGSSFSSSTSTTSPCDLYSPDSAKWPPEASFLSQATMSPSEINRFVLPGSVGTNLFPCSGNTQSLWGSQLFAEVPPQMTTSDIPHGLSASHGFTAMQLDGSDMDSSDNNSHTNYGDIECEFQNQNTMTLQEWAQQGYLVTDLPTDVPQELDSGAEMLFGAEPARVHSPSTSTDACMPRADPLMPSDGNPPPTTGDNLAAVKCQECLWVPDLMGNRSMKKLRQAVEKHFKRNHRSRVYQCPVCSQSFKNRPDNVKPHVLRKHPDRVAALYPRAAAPGQDDPQADKSGVTAPKPSTGRNGRVSRPRRS
jgi:hypothetical protein